MYKIVPTDYGLSISVYGRLCKMDAINLLNDVQFKAQGLKEGKFGIVFDLRDIEPICAAVFPTIVFIFAFLEGKGMQRSAIIYSSHAQVENLINAATAVGLSRNQRYFSTMAFPNPEEIVDSWIKRGKDPLSLVLRASK